MAEACATALGRVLGLVPAGDNPEWTEPSVLDVLVVRAMLVKGLRLPLELVNSILDGAEYWPHTTAGLDANVVVVHSGSGPGSDNRFLIRSHPLGFFTRRAAPADPDFHDRPPLPGSRLCAEHDPAVFRRHVGLDATLARPARKIVFTIVSHDQGWGDAASDRDTYNGSWTWFEAGLERFDASASPPRLGVAELRTVDPETVGEEQDEGEEGEEPHQRPSFKFELLPREDRMIQRNLTANRGWSKYVLEWRYDDDVDDPGSEAAKTKLGDLGRGTATGDGKFVRELKLGDVVTVWAKARFPGWSNHVRRVQVDVYWAV